MNQQFGRNQILKALMFGGLVGLVACSTVSVKEQAANDGAGARKPANHAWANYHWARTTPQFTLKVGDNLTTTDWKNNLRLATNDWNSPESFGAVFTPVLSFVVPGTSSKRCSMVKGTTQVCNGKYGNNGWLGLASINVNGDHITQGTAKMNDTYFVTTKYNNPNEKRHVMCQEVAHTFGLAHQSETGESLNTCMDYFSNTGVNATNTVSTRPNAHDFDQLNLIYNHVDATTTVSPMATFSANDTIAADDEVTNDPNSWGVHNREMSTSQSAYYERVHRNGSKTITHVLWTDERAAKCKDNCDHRFDH